MGSPTITFDESTATPITGGPVSPAPMNDQALRLQGAVSYASQQDPAHYAKLLQFQKLSGIPPVVALGNEQKVKQQADVNSINYPAFAAANPRTTAWASNPDNAAVSGVSEIQRLGGIEQNVRQMDQLPNGSVSVDPHGDWDEFKGDVSNAWDTVKRDLYSSPLSRLAISTVAGTAGTAGDIEAMGTAISPWSSTGPVKPNMLQRVQTALKPENVFANDPNVGVADYAKSNGMDKVAPLLASVAAGFGLSGAVGLGAKIFGWSENAAKVATALSVGTMFSAQAGGAEYTRAGASGSGVSNNDARIDAIRTFGINLPANTLAGFTDMIPGLKDNPFLSSVGTGALMGGSAQVGSNIATGQPWNQGLLMASGQGAAIQAGMHMGMSLFHANLAEAVGAANASELKARAPQTFREAVESSAGGGPSLRIPVDEFNAYFNGQKMDPQAVASDIGSTNYAEAHMSGGDVEVPKAGFLADLDEEHQKALFPHIVDPVTDLTPTQFEQGRQELTDWETNGGTEKMIADMREQLDAAKADPQYQQIKDDISQKMQQEQGVSPAQADAVAEIDAMQHMNAARAGMSPLDFYNARSPEFVSGDAPSISADESTAPDTLHQQAIRSIRDVVESAQADADYKGSVSFAPVSPWLKEAARANGVELDGFSHAIDADSVRHSLNSHGDADTETSRGQIAVTPADFEKIPQIVSDPDRVVLGGKTKRRGLDSIGYVKRLEDGTIAHIEERRTGKKQLASVTMVKHPAGADIDRIAENLHLNARSGGEDASPIIIRNPNADNDILHQSGEEQPRGWYAATPDGKVQYGRTPFGDPSTPVHEQMGHGSYEMLRKLAAAPQASEQLKADLDTVHEWMGVKPGEEPTRDQLEKYGRAVELYFTKGESPTPETRGAFQRIAVWMSEVYKDAMRRLGVEISPELRGVFDRWFAAKDSVDRSEQAAGPQLFQSAEEAGWTDEQFEKYAEMKGMSVADAHTEILGKLNEAALRDRTDAWREEESNVRAAMTDTIDAQPEYQAIRSLRDGELEDGTPLTLNKAALVDQFGEERVKALQEQHPGLYRVEGGTDAETAAEIHGFHSADEMMQALEAAPKRDEAIDTATRAYMTAKHGDIRYDGSLQDKADLASMNDARAQMKYNEMVALKRRNTPEFELRNAERELNRYLREQRENGEQDARLEKKDQRIADLKGRIAALEEKAKQQKLDERGGKRLAQDLAPMAAYREAAQQMVQEKSIVDLQPTRYLDASRKFGRESKAALARGDWEDSLEAGHKDLLNEHLYREAMKAKEYVGKFEGNVKRWKGNTVQQNLGIAGSDYRSQFNNLMARYEIAFMPRTDPTTRSLAEWADAEYKNGKEPAIAEAMYNERRTANYRGIPLSELHEVHDALKNIKTLAYQEMHMVVNGRKIAFSDALNAMVARARESVKVHPEKIFAEDRNRLDAARDFVNRGVAPTIRTEFLMKRLDGGVEGPWHDNLWHMAADAQGVERKLQEGVTKVIGDALKNIPDEQRMRMMDKVDLPGWGVITRKRLISMAMNLGNDGNLDRLRKTFEYFGKNANAVAEIPKLLSRNDWELVQTLWDSLKPMGERMYEMERRLTGLPPVMVTPTPLHIKLTDGSAMDLAGGYYPIAMDPRYSERAQQQDVNATARNLMESGYGRAATSRGYTKARTGFAGPLLLDHEQVLTQHIAKASKDISHREFILAANRFLQNPELQQTLRETVGPGYESQMMPWLRTLINDRNGSAVQGLGDLSNWMGRLRTNVVEASLGFKVSTLLLQVTHASSIFLHTSPGSFSQALIGFLAHPNEMTEQIRSMSPNEMKNRGENIDRDMRSILQDGIEGQKLSKTVAKAGMFPVKMVDHLLSFPLWLAVHGDAMAEQARAGVPEDRAQYLAMQKADGAVRMGLGSNAPKDLPAVMRKNDLWKMITMLGGFENLKLNQIADAAYGVSGSRVAGASRTVSGGRFTYQMLMAAMIPAVLGAYVSGNGPKDDENPAEWAAKRALIFAPETVPLLGNIARALDEGGDAKFTPFVNVIGKAVTAGVQAKSDKEDKDWTGIGLNAGEAAGEAAGVPGTIQGARILRYVHRAQEGKISDPNAWDAVVGAPASTKHR